MNILEQLNFKIYSPDIAEKVAKSISSIKAEKIKGEGEFEVIATTEGVDRDGEVISVAGWNFDNFMKNPIMLWGHNYWDLNAIVGAVTDVRSEDGKVIVRGVFASTDSGQYARKLYDDGILRAVSVGFIPKERNGATITKAELLEISFVSVPANPDALSISKLYKMESIIKTIVPEHQPEIAPEETEWDEAGAIERITEWATDGEGNVDFEKLKEGFTYYNEESGVVELPHHDIIDGTLVVVWQGVLAAMNTLLGEGNPVPEEEKEAAYNHLKIHFEQFGQEPPELGQDNPEEPEGASEDEEAVKGAKAGRVLSSKNREKVVQAAESMKETVKLLEDLLAATEPDKSAVDDLAKQNTKAAQALQKMVEEVVKNSKLLQSNV